MPEYPYEHYVGTHPADLMPDELQIEQVEAPGLVVPVELGSPAKVQQLGALDGAIYAVVVDDTQGGKLLNTDQRRSQVQVIPFDNPIFLGLSLSEVQAANAAPIAKGTVVFVKNVNRLFARSATAGQTAKVTVIADQWTQ